MSLVREKRIENYQIAEVWSSEKKAEWRRSNGSRLRFQYNRVKIRRITPEGAEEIWKSNEFPAKWKTDGSKGGRAWACAEVIVNQLLGRKIEEKVITGPVQQHLPTTSGRRLVLMSGRDE